MKAILLSLVIFLSCALSSQAGYTVNDAISRGYLKISGYASSSYTEATLTVQNVSSLVLDIDFSSAWFVQANDTQRVGLAYEKSTGAYYLRLKVGYNQKLVFSSRCLDLQRHAPVTGTTFTKIYSISSQFSRITDALHRNASQGDVWNITNNSGAFSTSWQAADPRVPVGGGGGGGGGGTSSTPSIDLSGSVSWSTSGNYININAGKLANTLSSGTSGSLRLQIWATQSKYAGGTISGRILGTRNLSALKGGYSYSNISGGVPYTRPPSGTYYTTITAEEYTSSGWVIRDYINFSSTSRF